MLFLLACLDNDPIPGGEAESFVAMQADFSGFRSWESTAVSTDDTGHSSGARTVWINTRSTGDSFAVGTMIVKSIVTDAGTDLHAMVKRGGGYNADGAVGWEWFELIEVDAVPVIKWRGEVAPEGEAYGALPGSNGDTADSITGDCNVCHATAASNDFVHSVAL